MCTPTPQISSLLFLLCGECCRYQEQIDQVVHNIARLKREKDCHGETSKATSALWNAIRSEHVNLDGRLRDMYVWMSAASDDPSENVELPREVVQGMLQGEPAPWHVGGACSSLRLMLGRRFFVVTNDQARCAEQLAVLPLEKRRLVQWLLMMLDLISGHLGVMEEKEACSPIEGAPWLLTTEHGVSFWLKWHGKRVGTILSRVNELEW